MANNEVERDQATALHPLHRYDLMITVTSGLIRSISEQNSFNSNLISVVLKGLEDIAAEEIKHRLSIEREDDIYINGKDLPGRLLLVFEPINVRSPPKSDISHPSLLFHSLIQLYCDSLTADNLYGTSFQITFFLGRALQDYN